MKALNEPLQELLSSSPVVLLQVGGDDCAPCHAIRRKLDLWLESHPGVTARYVDISAQRALCAQMGIFSVPTVIVYMEGRVLIRKSGYFSLDSLLEQTERYMELMA